jgi:hypothetical protein
MMKNKISEINISRLFDKEPGTGWASRGNPHLWDEMRLKSKNMQLLENEDEMKKYFYKLFKQITGIEIFDKKYVKINKYLLDSGMSNGIVTCSWWIETGIPLLLDRYKNIKNFVADNVIIDEENIKNLGKRYENSIEEAIKRIFMFNEINIDSLIELLEMDNNINRISNRIKKIIIENTNYKILDKEKVNFVMEKMNKSKNNCT